MKLNNPVKGGDFFPELTPLIDVMFLLLVFFMLTTTFEKESTASAITMDLPFATQSVRLSQSDVVEVNVNREGAYFMGGEQVKSNVMPDLIKMRVKMTGDSTILIGAHMEAPYQSIIFIYDILQAQGLRHVAHQVRVKGQ